jgi:hypothetical protein
MADNSPSTRSLIAGVIGTVITVGFDVVSSVNGGLPARNSPSSPVNGTSIVGKSGVD